MIDLKKSKAFPCCIIDCARLTPRLVLFLAVLACSGALTAQIEKGSAGTWLEEVDKLLNESAAQLAEVDPKTTTLKSLGVLQRQIDPIRNRSHRCIEGIQADRERLEQQLQSLGEAIEGEDPEVTKKRKELENNRTALDKTVSTCRLVLLRTQEQLGEINALEAQVRAQQFLAKGNNLWSVIKTNLGQYEAWWQALKDVLVQISGIEELSVSDFVSISALSLLALAGAILLARRVRPSPPAEDQSLDIPTGFVLSLRASTARALPLIVVMLVIATYLSASLPHRPLPLITQAVYGFTGYVVLVNLVNVLVSPRRPGKPYLPVDLTLSRAFGRRLKVLLGLMLIGFLLFWTTLGSSMPEPVYLLARAAYIPILAVNVVWIVWLLARLSPLFSSHGVRALLVLTTLGALAAEWIGYRNLSFFLLRGVVAILVGLGFALLASRLLGDLFDGLDEGRLPWQRGVRSRLRLGEGELVPGLAWVRFLMTITIWGLFTLWTLRVLGLSEEGTALILRYFSEGFHIGTLNIVPMKLIIAVLVLALLVSLIRTFKQQLSQRWLTRTRLDRGAREAMVTLSGYLGVGFGILIALSIAGVEFKNLAIIAGALSVGIGFGLQNIVNNFVSGIILLFERPIRTGDWIVVGSTEGYVRRISIRSTTIQTFDRADVIVPNSELISGQVTNWMLADTFGRVRVPVGVAYGSDVEKVKELLLGIAHAHPGVITSGLVPKPLVLFMGFGDSALNFELRCFIYKVDTRLSVISELNFKVDRAFREEGIQIPFPQRDLYVKQWPSNGEAEIVERSRTENTLVTDDDMGANRGPKT